MIKQFTKEQVLHFRKNLENLASVLNKKKIDLSLLDRVTLENIMIDLGKTKIKPIISFKVTRVTQSQIQIIFDLTKEDWEMFQAGLRFNFFLGQKDLGSIDFYFPSQPRENSNEIDVNDYSNCDGISELVYETIFKSKTNKGFSSLEELNELIIEFIEFEKKLFY